MQLTRGTGRPSLPSSGSGSGHLQESPGRGHIDGVVALDVVHQDRAAGGHPGQDSRHGQAEILRRANWNGIQ